MTVRGWLIVGTDTASLPQNEYMGDWIGALPNAANFKVGQWATWRPVPALVAQTPTMMAVVCVEIPL